MRRHWLLSLLVVAAALGGYAAGAQPIEAQAQPFPFVVGDTVLFTRPDEGKRECKVEELRGMFVRCERPDDPRFRGGDRWMNVSVMLQVEMNVR